MLAMLALTAAVSAGTASPAQPLRDCAAPPAQDTAVAWTQAGIVFTRRRRELQPLLTSVGARRATVLGVGDGVWTRDGTKAAVATLAGVDVEEADGTRVATFPNAADPAWSPDGMRLSYTRAGSVHVARWDGTDDAALAAGGSASWSPDGDRLVYDGSDGRIRIVRADGSGDAPITPAAGGFAPSWSHDGRLVAFVHVDPGGARIGFVRPDGTGYHLGPVLGTGATYEWSPTRDEVVFGSYDSGFGPDRVGFETAAGRIRVLPPEQAPRGTFWLDELGPHWSPDGRRIVFTVEDLGWWGLDGVPPGGRSELWLADARSGAERRLTYHCQFPIAAQTRIYGTRLPDRIVVADGRAERISCLGGRDTVVADRRDAVGRDCEVVLRRNG